jgi:hypothetical protein
VGGQHDQARLLVSQREDLAGAVRTGRTGWSTVSQVVYSSAATPLPPLIGPGPESRDDRGRLIIVRFRVRFLFGSCRARTVDSASVRSDRRGGGDLRDAGADHGRDHRRFDEVLAVRSPVDVRGWPVLLAYLAHQRPSGRDPAAGRTLGGVSTGRARPVPSPPRPPRRRRSRSPTAGTYGTTWPSTFRRPPPGTAGWRPTSADGVPDRACARAARPDPACPVPRFQRPRVLSGAPSRRSLLPGQPCRCRPRPRRARRGDAEPVDPAGQRCVVVGETGGAACTKLLWNGGLASG